MREGGLDAAFFSIWFPGTVTGPTAVRRALGLIDEVREAVRANARDLTLATSVADIRRAQSQTARIAILLGMEGGHMIDDDLRMLRNYAALGVRYLTLTHSRHTHWADSSGETPATHGGLTTFGRAGRAGAEPAWRDGGRLTRLGRDVRGRAGGQPRTDDRVAFVLPRDLEQRAQHDRRHAARDRRQGRRRDDQLPRPVPQRRLPRRARSRPASSRRRRRSTRPAATTSPAPFSPSAISIVR